MGLFGGGADRKVEKDLVDLYTNLTMSLHGFGEREAREMAQGLMTQAKEMAKKERAQDLPPNYGDSLLQREKSEPAVAQLLAKKRAEAVKDEDIRWWWNLHYLEQYMMIASDNANRMALFVSELKAGKTPEQAAEQIRKTFPMYGSQDDTKNSSGEDRPLPYELKDRVNNYLTVESGTNVDDARRRRAAASSVNAFVRAEMKAGRL